MNPALNAAANAGMAPVATPWFFYVLGGLAVASGLAVITRRNAVHSALALIVTLLSVAGLYLMLYAPFVAGVQIIVYAGGIMVLFLFVIASAERPATAKASTTSIGFCSKSPSLYICLSGIARRGRVTASTS